MQNTIEIDSVIKSFGNNQLLTDIYLKCKTGDIIGLFGRNGTGKTVLMNILFGTMNSDRKFIRYNENNIIDKPYLVPNLINYLPQYHFFPKHLTIDEITNVFLMSVSKDIFFDNDEVALSSRKFKANTLSSGQLRYLEIKLLLLQSSKFLLLDEPFNFLSPLLIKQAAELIKNNSQNKGIILTDHNYRNVLNICNRIVLLKDGALRELNNEQELIDHNYLINL